jgi:hypothetical protein
MKNIFNPLAVLSRLFKPDYKGRMDRMLELALYEAKLQLIKAEEKLQYDSALFEYHTARVITLVEELDKVRNENAKDPIGNTIKLMHPALKCD